MYLSDVNIFICGEESEVVDSFDVDYGLIAYYATLILNYDYDYLCRNSLNRIVTSIAYQYHLYTKESIESFLVEKCSE
ncbi:hypothetical protein AOC03_07230 [Psychrobacter urativorans]|uniref:Uncharacterized protein n=1 Tax=Psychrobacter urativorans TaxID=45610 RepID=A0A0M3V917_9GAMM|nr:hypothetical protein AOC03_07230 [Psychrobacter urativorans]